MNTNTTCTATFDCTLPIELARLVPRSQKRIGLGLTSTRHVVDFGDFSIAYDPAGGIAPENEIAAGTIGNAPSSWREYAAAGMIITTMTDRPVPSHAFESDPITDFDVAVCEVAWVKVACDVDATRYALGGVALTQSGSLVATDGRRIHGSWSSPDMSFCGIDPSQVVAILPLATCDAIVKLAHKKAFLSIQVLPTCVLVAFETKSLGRVVMRCRVLEGRFPRFQDCFPSSLQVLGTIEPPTKADVKAWKARQVAESIAKLEAARIVLSKATGKARKEAQREVDELESPIVKMTLHDSVSDDGEPVKRCFDIRYLSDIELVSDWSADKPEGPCHFRHNCNGRHRSALVMPLSLGR